MSTLPDRPDFGAIYVLSHCSWGHTNTCAVRVLGWTSKKAIVQEVPIRTGLLHVSENDNQETYTGAFNTLWFEENPLPAEPLTKKGEWSSMSIHGGRREGFTEVYLRGPSVGSHSPVFSRCNNIKPHGLFYTFTVPLT